MGMFKDMLGSEESLFRDSVALDYDYLPKILKFREKEQRHFATCIKPLLANRNGRNLFTHGVPGIGKTAACRWVLKDLEEETESVIPLYINCWKFNTSYKIMTEICDQLGIRFIVNKKTSELFQAVKKTVNKKSVVFVFDEIDKLEDFDFLYMILEDVYRKSVFLITNYVTKLNELDERILSRLNAEMVEFKSYNAEETKGILKERMKYAFVPGVWDEGAFELVAAKCFEAGDVRTGLYLMREAGNIAEDGAARKINKVHVEEAIRKSDEFSIKKKEELGDELQEILKLIKEKSGAKIGDVFRLYQEKGGTMSYKNFTRKVEKLKVGKFISTQKVTGEGGNTTILDYSKKLTEF
jgi:cell division control protein 6